MPLDSLVTFIIASTVLGLAPGPDNLFVLAQSALFGKKAGVLVTLGLMTGLIVHTTAVALGVAVIFQTSMIAFTALKIIGALYLLYLAWQALRAPADTFDAGQPKRRSNLALYRRGILMSSTNPKVSMFFLAFLPQFASPEYGALAPQIFILGALFMAVSLVLFSAIAMLAGALGEWLNRSAKAHLYLNRITGLVFIGLALKLLTAKNTPE